MSDYHSQSRAVPGTADMAVDAGLRAFMLGVYNKMMLGLLLSGGIAYAVAVTPALQAIFFTSPMVWVVLFAPLALILISSIFMRNPSPTGANIIYWGVVATMKGDSLSAMFLMDQGNVRLRRVGPPPVRSSDEEP